MKNSVLTIFVISMLLLCGTNTLLSQPTDGLVVHYPFNGNANDESGNGYDCIPDANWPSLTTDRFGNPNSAYDFDGIDNKIVTPINSGLTNSVSFCVWYKIRSYDVDAALISARYLPGGGYNYSGLGVSNNPVGSNIVSFHTKYASVISIYDESYRNNEWHFIVGTYDGSVMKLYGDGQLKASQAEIGPIDLMYNYIIGYDNTVHLNRYFDGIIDDIRIYNRALSESEILELYGGFHNSLVAYYPFNGNANDESGNGNDGTVQGASLTTDRFGNCNSAFYFDGVTDYIEVSHSEDLILQHSLTLAAWVKSDIPINTETYIIAKGDEVPFSLRTKNGNYDFDVGNNRLSSYALPTSTTPIEQEWHFLVGTYDGTNARIYVDGILEDIVPYNETLLYDTGTMQFGHRPTSRNYSVLFFKGVIDDIRIYNYAINETEILELYNEQKPYNDCLVAYYPFNGNANDESGNGNDGTEVGGVSYQEGICGTGAEFDGIDDYLTVPISSSLSSITNQATIAMFVKYTEPVNPRSYCLWRYGTTVNNVTSSAKIGGGDNILYALHYSNGQGLGGVYVKSINPLVENQWYHIALCYDGTKEQLFINGELQDEVASTVILDTPDDRLWFGRNGYAANPKYYNGIIDEIRIYNRALTETEIMDLYNECLTPEEMVENIIDDIEELINSGDLDENNAFPLITKLENAIDKNNITPAINQLEAFINQVNAYISAEILTEEQGQSLITAVEEVIAELILLGKTSEQLSIANSNILNEYILDQNYPNPFNPTTTIKYGIPEDNQVTLKIYDFLGIEVATLVNEYKTAGSYQYEFDASKLASGLYLYQLKTNNFILTKKMILMK